MCDFALHFTDLFGEWLVSAFTDSSACCLFDDRLMVSSDSLSVGKGVQIYLLFL